MNTSTLRITEIFYSLQGETRLAGLPTVFIRLTGCPLRCQYCDTAYAFHGGKQQSLSAIIAKVADYQASYVTVTGGEPLAQPNSLLLIQQLCDLGYNVSLETSGALDISQVDSRVIKVLDIKTPGSKEVSKNLLSNFQYLHKMDQIKFVICDEDDYQWAKLFIVKHDLHKYCEILFSPSHLQLSNQELANWILRDRLKVRMQLQLHKYIWGDIPGV